jgi:transcriptional regulator with XRE-family HTH domain
MLADARARLGWPVAVAARQVGISDRMLRYLERGERVPSTAVAEDIISGLGLDEIDADLLRSVALPDVGRASPFRGGDARLLRYAGAAGPGGES